MVSPSTMRRTRVTYVHRRGWIRTHASADAVPDSFDRHSVAGSCRIESGQPFVGHPDLMEAEVNGGGSIIE
jgi:hypothetical protein